MNTLTSWIYVLVNCETVYGTNEVSVWAMWRRGKCVGLVTRSMAATAYLLLKRYPNCSVLVGSRNWSELDLHQRIYNRTKLNQFKL